MRQLTIVFLIALSSYCGLATARCLTGDERGKMFVDCAERASPGISDNLAKFSRVIKAVKDYNAKQYGATTSGDTSNDSLEKTAKVISECFATKLSEASPEMEKIWDMCDERTNYQMELRKNCVREEYEKICPSTVGDRSKRSPVPHLEELIWAIGK